MQIFEFTSNNKNVYAQLTQTWGAAFNQSWVWGEWQKSLGTKIQRFGIKSDALETIPLVCECIENKGLLGVSYIHCVYGPVYNTKISKEEKIQALATLSKEIQKQFPSALCLRIEPTESGIDFSTLAKKSLNTHASKTIVLDLVKNHDALLTAMHPKHRYNIKLAERHGVNITTTPLLAATQKTKNAVIDLVLETQDRQGYRGRNRSYLEKLLAFFSSPEMSEINVSLYTAWYQNSLTATGIMFDFGNTRSYVYGGSSEKNRNIMAPYLLHWQALKDAQARGLNTYDFGGSETTGGNTPGFLRFKQGFGGREVVFAGAWDIIYKPIGYEFYSRLRNFNRLILKIK